VPRYARMFAAMGAEPRLRIMQLLLTAHPRRLIVGDLQEELEIPGSRREKRRQLTPLFPRVEQGYGYLAPWRHEAASTIFGFRPRLYLRYSPSIYSMSHYASPALSLAAAASWGAADFSGGIASKRANAIGVVAMAHAVGWTFMLALALIFAERIPGWRALAWGALAGAVGGIGLAAFYRALAVGKMGINAPLSAVITAVLPVIFSFRTEGLPRAVQLAGFALALAGIWLMTFQRTEPASSKGIGLAVIAGFGFSGFLLLMKLAGTQAVFWPLVAARTASCLLMICIIAASVRDWKPGRAAIASIVAAGLLDSGANALYVAAAQRGRLDVAAVLSSLYPASTVILARVTLKERLSLMQSAGVIAALAAAVMISAR